MSSEVITRNDLKAVINNLLPIFYPVGSYYETSDTTFNPNTEWGGTWVLETEGLVHISAGTNYAVNGAPTDTQDGGSPYIQAHTHGFTQPTVNNGGITNGISGGTHSHNLKGYGDVLGSGKVGWRFGSGGSKTATGIISGDGGHTHTLPNHTHSVSGGAVGAVSGATTGNAGNMQPYIIVNRWHRTA